MPELYDVPQGPPAKPEPEHGVRSKVHPRNFANPTPPTNAAVKQAGYVHPAAFGRWNIVRDRIAKIWPKLDSEQQDQMTHEFMKSELADNMSFDAEYLSFAFERASRSSVEHFPTVMAHVGAQQGDPQLVGAVSEADNFLTQLYGADDLGPFLSTFVINPEVSAEKTRNILTDITGVQYGGWLTGTTLPESQDALENLLTAADPIAAFKALDADTQAGVHILAQNLLASGATVNERVFKAHEILNSGEYAPTLSESDLRRVREIMVVAEDTAPGRTSDLNDYTEQRRQKFIAAHPDQANVDEGTLNRMLGIDQYRAIEDGILVIDRDWAEQYPDKASALKVYLEQQYPDVELQVGRDGIVGSALDGFGRVIENIAAPVGSAWKQVSEIVERLNFGPFKDYRTEMQAALDENKRRMAIPKGEPGYIPDSQRDDYLKVINNYEEDLTDSFGWDSFVADRDEAVSTKAPGMGFGSLYAQGMGINPGDAGYAPLVAVSGLASQIILDPINWVTGGLGGFLDARYLPKFAGTALELDDVIASLRLAKPGWSEESIVAWATRTVERDAAELAANGGFRYPRVGGLIQQRVYQGLARTPEELATTRPFQKAFDEIWALKQALQPDEFVTEMATRLNSRDAATRLLHAESAEDVRAVLVRGMTGGAHSVERYGIDGMLLERARISKRIRALKYSEDGQPWERKVADLEDQWDEVYASRRSSRTDELNDLDQELDYATAKLEDYQSLHQDLRARRAYLTDVINGRNIDEPLTVLRGTVVKRMRDLREEATLWDDAIVHPDDAATINGSGGRAINLWRTYRHAFTNYGWGKNIVLDGPEVTTTLRRLSDFGQNLGVSERRMTQLLAPLASKELDGNIIKQFDWLTDTWRKMIDESDLPAVAKAKLHELYNSREGPRIAGLVNEPGQIMPIPVLYDRTRYGLDLAEDALSNEGLPSGWPSISSRELKKLEFKLPTLEQMYEVRGFTRNLLHDMKQMGAPYRQASSVLAGLGKGWEATMDFWKHAVLLPRLFGALPARIFFEQQVRMAGFGAASAVWHPLQWFESFGEISKRSWSELRLFSESPEDALGTIVSNFAQHGRNIPVGDVVYGDSRFNEGINNVLLEWTQSPEFKRWHLENLGDTEATLAAMRLPENRWLSEKFFQRYKQLGYTPKEAIELTQRELIDHIGSGAGAERIRNALANEGWTVYNGKRVKIGSKGFTNMLDDLTARGEWVPRTKRIPSAAFAFVPADKPAALRNLRDWIYRWCYTKLDLAASRSPLYRTLAQREFRNLRASGYDVAEATTLAGKVAAERTADIMFEIGAHTTGEHFLKTTMPFFPAWRELADTYLFRLPGQIGKIGSAEDASRFLKVTGWGLGSVELAHRVNLIHDAALATGLLRHDAEGNLEVPIGFSWVNALMNGVLGTDVPMLTSTDVQSSFGIFPIPLQLLSNDKELSPTARLFGALPTLGAPATLALDKVEDLLGHPHWTEYLNDAVAPYGMDPNLSTNNVTNIMVGLGLERYIFWETNSARTYREAIELSTASDGLRIYTQDHPVPDYPKNWDDMPEDRRQIWQENVLAPWLAAGIHAADQYKTGFYLGKGIAGSLFPMSFDVTDEGSEAMAKMWDSLRVFEGMDDSTNPSVATITNFMKANPELEAYLTSKYIDTRTTVNSDESFDDVHEAIANGTLQARTPTDLAILMIGRNNVNALHRRKDTLDKRIQAHENPVLFYLTHPKVRQVRSERSREIRDYFDWQSTPESKISDDQTKTFTELYNQSNEFRMLRNDEHDLTYSLTRKQEKLLDAEDAMSQLDKWITLDPEAPGTQKFYHALNRVHEAISKAYDATEDPFWKAVGQFYETNGHYYAETGKLYDQLGPANDTEDSYIYNQIRNLSNQYSGQTTYHGYTLPSPEEYQWAAWTPQEQEDHIAKWNSLPAEYLTEFQREQAGYNLSSKQQKQADGLANYAFRVDRAKDKYIENGGNSDSAREISDKAVAQYAADHGLKKYWAQANQPDYIKIGNALHLDERTADWTYLSNAATSYRAQIQAAGYEPSGNGLMAQQAYAYFLSAYHSMHSPELTKIIMNMSTALATSSDNSQLDEDATVLRLFFDVYNP